MERVPFAYHDEKKIRADLDAAGFTDCVIDTVALAGHGRDARSPALGMCQGSPLGAEIETLEPNGLQAATEAVAAMITERFGKGPFKRRCKRLWWRRGNSRKM